MSVALDSVMESQAAQLNLLLYQIYRPYFNGKTHLTPITRTGPTPPQKAGLRKAFVTLELSHSTQRARARGNIFRRSDAK